MALIAIMANHPEIQTRMQREIDEKIGDAEPRLKDRAKMHYVNAVCVCAVCCTKGHARERVGAMGTKWNQMKTRFQVRRPTQTRCASLCVVAGDLRDATVHPGYAVPVAPRRDARQRARRVHHTQGYSGEVCEASLYVCVCVCVSGSSSDAPCRSRGQ